MQVLPEASFLVINAENSLKLSDSSFSLEEFASVHWQLYLLTILLVPSLQKN